MTPPQLFPFPLVSGNIEGLHTRHSRTGSFIYITVVLLLLVAAASLPLIEVEVNSKSRGILRPEMKLAPVVSPVSGKVTMSELRENGPVCAGDTLLTISTAELTAEASHLRTQIDERTDLLHDLNSLTPSDLSPLPTLKTAVYQRDHRDYRRQIDALQLQRNHAQRQLDRQRQLMETGSVARMDLEQSEYEVTTLDGQLARLQDQQRHSWTQDQQRIQRERAQLRQQLQQLEENARRHVVTASIDGQLTRTEGLQPGTYATSGQTLAQISPDGDLRVEAYINPSDIGLLKVGLPVRLQLDAFNYNQWGLAHATLTDIGKDVTEVDGQAAFLVTCTLHDKELKLKNGYTGALRKGMTLTAHFTLTRRSLFQLLHDKIDDWFNPSYN